MLFIKNLRINKINLLTIGQALGIVLPKEKTL